MSGILWKEMVFGPIKSRRLGNSLGINLLPGKLKICSFNCIYCECGWGKEIDTVADKVFSHTQIAEALELRLKELKAEGQVIDSITFAGNGEPTMHPEFSEVVDDLVVLRDRYFPEAKTSCLSNSTRAFDPKIRAALMKLDNVLMKLDAGDQKTFDLINRPFVPISADEVVENLVAFNGSISIQTLFLRGEYEGETIDNTTDQEVEIWLDKIAKIAPKKVVIYPIDRETPARNLQKLDFETLNAIAEKVKALGIPCEVYA